MVAAITGDKKLMRALNTLKTSAANRAMARGIRKGAQHGAKAVKASIPSRYKNARKSTGWRSLKRSRNNGMPGAKVGAAVGRQREKKKAKRSSRGGVGISTRNIHWLFLGTKVRATKDGRRRGVMPPQVQPVAETMMQEAGTISALIKKHTWEGIEKEIAKLRRK